MELSAEEKKKDRKYPGATNMNGLGIECGFYSLGSLAMSYKVYKLTKIGKNPLYASAVGMFALFMLNYKVGIIIDLIHHVDRYPELYEGGELSGIIDRDNS